MPAIFHPELQKNHQGIFSKVNKQSAVTLIKAIDVRNSSPGSILQLIIIMLCTFLDSIGPSFVYLCMVN